MNKPEVGTTLYLYGIRSGKFTVRKGTVVDDNKQRLKFYRRVQFTDKPGKEWCPEISEIGKLQYGRIWMTERDDKKARDMFLEHEVWTLRELEDKIAYKKSLITMLESVGMEG